MTQLGSTKLIQKINRTIRPEIMQTDHSVNGLNKRVCPEQKGLYVGKQSTAEIEGDIAKFIEYWEIDSNRKEVRRKSRSIPRKLLEFFWPPQFQVKVIYRGLNSFLGSEQGIVHPDIINRDGIHVAGYSEKFVMKSGWRIAGKDRKFLTDGPLIYEGSNEVIIPARRGLEFAKSLAKEWGPLIGIGSFFLAIVKLFLG